MYKKLPPLKALRAFEASARHGSLTKAAEELFVSAGAVSQQVKLLEEFIDQPLFERRHRQIVLTETGKRLMPGVSAAFDQIQLSVDKVMHRDQSKPLTISAAPSFAGRWLVPRLQRFNQQHPEIDVRIDTSCGLSDLVHSDIDVGIRFGTGQYPGLQTDFLSCQEVFPVCAPSLIKPNTPLQNPDDLRHYQLLHYDYPHLNDSWPDWQMWLAAVGSGDVESHRGLRFVEVNLLIDAAIRGQGVALAGSISVKSALASEELIRPFEMAIPLDLAYYFVAHESKVKQPAISAFRTWLLEEIGSEQDT